ncbi:MAG: hypothetical protein WBO66_05780, partial [Candidatus Moraniibacteriota bacterium]
MWSSAHNKGYPKRLVMGFVFVTIILCFVMTLLLLDRFRSHEASLDMLVLSRSEQGAIEAPAVRDALMLLGSQNDFLYTVNETADVNEINFSRNGETSFRMRTVSDTPLDARDGAVAASQELFATIGKYYDIRNDIAVRSIGSPKTKVIVTHPILLVGSGILSACILSLAFFACILSIARIAFSVRGKETVVSSESVFPMTGEDMVPYEETPPVFSPEMFVPKREESRFFFFEPSGAEREKDYAHFNRGPAPSNLPIAMDDSESLPDFLMPVKTGTMDEQVASEEP